MINRRRFLALSSTFTTLGAILPGAALGTNATRHTYSYGPAELDISVPANSQNLPVMIFVHGGAWRIGKRTHVQSKPQFFNDLGMIFVSIDYRLFPDVEVPDMNRDVGAAIFWVKNNIAQFGGNPDRIAVMGHSAGAHLVALAVISGTAPKVSALICNDTGAYDLNAMARLNGGELRRLTAPAFHDQSQWNTLSPATYVGTRAHPPTLLMWSQVRDHDQLALQFGTKLSTAGTLVSTFAAPNLTHAQINKSIGTGNPIELDNAISDFLQVHL